MPLIKSTSKEAFSHNVAAERKAGKPEKQSVAIAYSEKRRASARKGALEHKKNSPHHRLEHLRKQIKKENISYGEIAELQSLKKHIKPHDTQLREWAGIPEHEK